MTVIEPDARTPEMTAGIQPSADGRLWHLRTARSSYVVGVDGDLVTQRYWGPALDDSALQEFAALDRLRWNSSFQRPSEIDEELPVDGGHRWSVPSLQVSFDDGVRSLEPEFDGADLDGDQLVIHLLDRGFAFAIDLHYRLRPDSDVIERWVRLRNRRENASARILRADSASWLLPDQDDFRSTTVHGYWAAETQLERRSLPTGEYVLTSRHGTTGQQSNPWMMLDDGSATENHGEIRSIALAWSGSWRLTATRRPEGGAAVTAGFGHDGLSWPLEPGQSLTTPSSYGLWSDGGFGAASRVWHEFTRRHVLSHPEEVRPILFNSWEATKFDVTEESQKSLAARAAAIGVELFVIDDGWFGARDTDRAGLGDWTPNPERFPNGLHGVVDAVRGLGMRFGIWVEPEMVNPDSDVYRAHPDWVQHWPDRRRDERRYQLVLNFGRQDVRDWAVGWLSELVSTYGVDYVKWDMNRPFTQAGWPERPGAHDLIWIEHTRGVYEVMDRVRAIHPELRLEACASGGARADLGVLQRTDQIWTSDNTDSLDRQPIQEGFSYLYPAQVMGAWVTEETNGMTGRRIPLDYRFHVAMAGNLGVGGNLDEWSPDALQRSAEHIALYKRIRATVQLGELYRLGGRAGRDYSAVQYVRAGQVVVIAYEPHRSLATTPRRLRLRGLDPQASYRDSDTGSVHTGAVLLGRGIRFNDAATLRGWDNTRFSSADYRSSVTVLERLS